MGARALRGRGLAALAAVALVGLGLSRGFGGEAASQEAAGSKALAGERAHGKGGSRRGGESRGGAESGRGGGALREEAASRVGGGEVARSLEGTEVDGGFDTDARGHLVMGPRVIALFDYFFSATGEVGEDALRERIAALAAARLSEPALGEALDLLDRYEAYREAGRRLGVGAGAAAEERLAAVRALRREHFGEAADALFGDEERAAEVAIAKSHIAQDDTLTAEERADSLAEAEERLPASTRAARAATTSVAQLRADERALRGAGADEAEIRRFRAGTLGAEAADRLESLDRERALWRSRIQAVREESDRVCSQAATRDACEAALVEAAFEERDRLRARAVLRAPAN